MWGRQEVVRVSLAPSFLPSYLLSFLPSFLLSFLLKRVSVTDKPHFWMLGKQQRRETMSPSDLVPYLVEQGQVTNKQTHVRAETISAKDVLQGSTKSGGHDWAGWSASSPKDQTQTPQQDPSLVWLLFVPQSGHSVIRRGGRRSGPAGTFRGLREGLPR